jgi:hypothetical protein
MTEHNREQLAQRLAGLHNLLKLTTDPPAQEAITSLIRDLEGKIKAMGKQSKNRSR